MNREVTEVIELYNKTEGINNPESLKKDFLVIAGFIDDDYERLFEQPTDSMSMKLEIPFSSLEAFHETSVIRNLKEGKRIETFDTALDDLTKELNQVTDPSKKKLIADTIQKIAAARKNVEEFNAKANDNTIIIQS